MFCFEFGLTVPKFRCMCLIRIPLGFEVSGLRTAAHVEPVFAAGLERLGSVASGCLYNVWYNFTSTEFLI